MGPYHKANEERNKIWKLFDTYHLGPLNKFVGYKVEIDRISTTAKLIQPVMIENFKDQFDVEGNQHVSLEEAGRPVRWGGSH